MATRPSEGGTVAPTPCFNGLGISSLVLGFLGLLFFWLVPLGILFSTAGIPIGIAGWVAARRGIRGGLGLAIGGTVLCILALILGIDLATGGLTRDLWSNRY
jgi:hypothetical protein